MFHLVSTNLQPPLNRVGKVEDLKRSLLVSTTKPIYKTRTYSRTVALVDFLRNNVKQLDKSVVFTNKTISLSDWIKQYLKPLTAEYKLDDFTELSIGVSQSLPFLDAYVEPLIHAFYVSKIQKRYYDLCISTSGGGMRAVFLKKIGGTGFHVHEDHDYGPAWATDIVRRTYATLFEKYMILNADIVISVSRTLAEIRRKWGATKVYTIPNGVDTKLFGKAVHLRLKNRPKNTLVYCGDIRHEWGVDLLLRAVDKVRKRRSIKLLLVGPCEDANIKRLIHKLALTDNVLYLGTVPHTQLPYIFSQAVIGVAPYRRGFTAEYGDPLKIKEYLSSGLAVLSTKVGEIPSFLSKAGGGICVEPDVDELSDAIIQLLDEPKLLKEMSESGRNYVNKYFDWNHLFKEEMKIISRECVFNVV